MELEVKYNNANNKDVGSKKTHLRHVFSEVTVSQTGASVA